MKFFWIKFILPLAHDPNVFIELQFLMVSLSNPVL